MPLLLTHIGFPFAFMSGFCTSAARLGAPDTGLISYSEMVDQVRGVGGGAASLSAGRGWWGERPAGKGGGGRHPTGGCQGGGGT